MTDPQTRSALIQAMRLERNLGLAGLWRKARDMDTNSYKSLVSYINEMLPEAKEVKEIKEEKGSSSAPRV